MVIKKQKINDITFLKRAFAHYIDLFSNRHIDKFSNWTKKTYRLTFIYNKGDFYVSGTEEDLLLFIMRYS